MCALIGFPCSFAGVDVCLSCSSDLELAMALQQQEDESARRAMASSVHPAQRSASNPPPHSRQGPITQQLGRLSGTSSHDPRKPPTSGPQAGTRVAYPQGRWAYGEGTETSGTSIAGSTGSSSGWSSTTWFSGGSKEPSAQTRIPQAPAVSTPFCPTPLWCVFECPRLFWPRSRALEHQRFL